MPAKPVETLGKSGNSLIKSEANSRVCIGYIKVGRTSTRRQSPSDALAICNTNEVQLVTANSYSAEQDNTTARGVRIGLNWPKRQHTRTMKMVI